MLPVTKLVSLVLGLPPTVPAVLLPTVSMQIPVLLLVRMAHIPSITLVRLVPLIARFALVPLPAPSAFLLFTSSTALAGLNVLQAITSILPPIAACSVSLPVWCAHRGTIAPAANRQPCSTTATASTPTVSLARTLISV